MEVAGAQRVLFLLADYLHDQGYSVQVVFVYDKQNLAADWQGQHSYPVVSLGGWKPGGFVLANLLRLTAASLRLYVLLRRHQVVLTYTPHSNLLGLPLAWLAGTPVRLGTHHGYIENAPGVIGWLHGKLTNSVMCSRMVCVSNQVRSLAQREEGARLEKLTVIDNGITPPAEVVLADEQKQALRESLGVLPGQILLITVGRLMVQKGHTYLLDAIHELNDPNVIFAFIGDGTLHQELKAKALALGIGDRVRFAGVRSDVPKLLAVADGFVQPSLWEGMSLALLEAMFAGLPIVATRIEASTDVLEDERTALLAEPRASASLAAELRNVIADAGLRTRLGRAAQQVARKRYTVEVMGAAYARLIQDLQSG